MQSRNPAFSRAEGFNGRSATATYPGSSQSAGYGDPSQWGTGSPGSLTEVDQGRMTIDSVVQKTGITLGVVVLAATMTWFLTGEIDTQAQLNGLYGISMFGAIGGFALAMANTFKKKVSPGLVLVYAALQGVFVGAFSKALETMFARPSRAGWPGRGCRRRHHGGGRRNPRGLQVLQHPGGQQVPQVGRSPPAMFGFLALSLLDVLLRFFGRGHRLQRLRSDGPADERVGLGLGVLLLILDFDFVERGIAAGLPERESWRAAFGLTVTIVWIYIEIIRILAILRGSD